MTIKNKIRHKLDPILRSWLNSIHDKPLRERLKPHVYIAGGAITSIIMGEKPRDYDIWVSSSILAAEVLRYYLAQTTHTYAGIKDIHSHIEDDTVVIETTGQNYTDYQYIPPAEFRHAPIHISGQAITLVGGLQFIFGFTGSPEKVTSKFDFVHAKNWYTLKDGVHLDHNAVMATAQRELKFCPSTDYPLASLFRLRKFIKRGWTISPGEMLKIVLCINKLDLMNPYTLRDQLVGVDLTYFRSLLHSVLFEKDEFNESLSLSAITSAIDNEFNNVKDCIDATTDNQDS